MRRVPSPFVFRVVSQLVLVIVAGCGGAASLVPTPDRATSAPTTLPSVGSVLPVVACETSYGLDESPRPLPSDEPTELDAVVAERLAVYANDVDRVLGPRDWSCDAQVGVDGSSFMRIADPADSAAAITSWVEPSCYGCALELACPLFPAAADLLRSDFGVDCPVSPDTRETTTVESGTVVSFDDPPGVAGTGAGSGGAYRAVGHLFFAGVDTPAAAQVTCTVAGDAEDLCGQILADWLTRWQP